MTTTAGFPRMRDDDDVVAYGRLPLGTGAHASVVAEGLRAAYVACRGLSVLDEALADKALEVSEHGQRRDAAADAATQEFAASIAAARGLFRPVQPAVRLQLPENDRLKRHLRDEARSERRGV